MIEEILTHILALDPFFETYEFIHTYLGPKDTRKKAKKIPFQTAIDYLSQVRTQLETNADIDDVFPYYRKTFIQDLIESVLIQAELFAKQSHRRNNEPDFKASIEKMYGLALCPPFDLEQEGFQTNHQINALGFSSINDCQKQWKSIHFHSKAQLKRQIVALIAQYLNQTQNQFSGVFPFDLHSLLAQNQISIEFSSNSEGHPCYYYYKSAYHGAVGIFYCDELTQEYLESFVMHEIAPGHHFYYLIRQIMLDQKKLDPLAALDIFYSPENIINEGLALNLYRVFDYTAKEALYAQHLIENLAHKIFYNCWHQVNIEQNNNLANYYSFLENIGYDKATAERYIKYFTHTEKYFAPSYALGNYYIEHFLQKFGYEKIALLYHQHSVHSLIKLAKDLDDANVKVALQ